MRIKKLSIVIPYYNRRELVFNVLRSIEATQGSYPVEIVVVDDGSSDEHNLNNARELFPTMDINVIVLKRSCGVWRGPAYAYNVGFAYATGDVILINSSECMHIGNVIEYVFDNMHTDRYITFSAYQGDEYLNRILSILPLEDIPRCLGKMNNGWHLHSSLYNIIPYCAAISAKSMAKLGGYDERFCEGIGFDDYDFTDRIYNLGLQTRIVDDPFVVHQWHPPTKYSNDKNYKMLMKIREEEPDRIKAKINHTV